jgi:signal transduction histidine kinase
MCYILVYTLNIVLKISQHKKSKILSKADDIHDSVVQRLFAMSCFTYDIINKWDQLEDNEKRSQIELVMETIRSSLIDLRSTIYNLSDKKQQLDHFADSITTFTSEMEKLSGVKIATSIEGDYENLMVGAKKAIYRIITECVGNAIKHAKCDSIKVQLMVGDTETSLVIEDDGIGLDLEKTLRDNRGLGLYNVRSLVRMFNGSVDILTDEKPGTVFKIKFANMDVMKGRSEL